MRRSLLKLLLLALVIIWIWTIAISFSKAKSLSFDESSTVVGSILSFTQREELVINNNASTGGTRFQSHSAGWSDPKNGHSHYHQSKSNNNQDDEGYPFEFAACLLTKDDKIILPEWLAYHYTVMPLRRLIVAIDPLSITNPEPIFDSWRNHTKLKITTWTGNWYWKISEWKHPILDKMPPKGDKVIDDTKLLRQSSFYTNCLQRLKLEGYSWTALIDTDEYFTYNSIMPVELLMKNDTTIQDGVLSAESRKRLPAFVGRQNETIAHWIHQHGTKERVISNKSLCIVYPRLQFFSKVENNNKEDVDNSSLLSTFGADIISRGNSSTPPRFDLEAFHTLQYTSHDRFDKSFKGGKPLPGKSLVNAALVGDDYKVKNPHSPFTFKCKGDVYNQITEGWPFRVHQYSGSLKVWLSRPERTKEMWEQRNKRDYRNHHDDSLTRWFPEFVRLLESSSSSEQQQHGDDDTKDALTLAYCLTQKLHDDAYNETMDIFHRLTLNETIPPKYEWDKPLGIADKRKARNL
mmetsp:Transcript_38433/g.93005  ORF Transcript_38433/g.93005 Transcript_38433/m.93005 type:complete len:520 (+) Transcript_38433:75-1634(+)